MACVLITTGTAAAEASSATSCLVRLPAPACKIDFVQFGADRFTVRGSWTRGVKRADGTFASLLVGTPEPTTTLFLFCLGQPGRAEPECPSRFFVRANGKLIQRDSPAERPLAE